MAKCRMAKSGAEIGAENVEILRRYLERMWATKKPLPRRGAELNRSAIAKACGFDRQVLYQNPTAAALLEKYERKDRAEFLRKLESAEIEREAKAKVDKDRSALEARVLKLESEIAQFRKEKVDWLQEKALLQQKLSRLSVIEKVMTETGRLP